MASDNELLIRLGVETSDAKKQISEVNKELQSLQKQIKNTNDTTDGYNKTYEGLNKTYKLQVNTLDALKTKLSSQITVQQNATKEYERRKAVLDKLQNSEKANAKEIDKARKSVEVAQRQMNQANRDIDSTRSEIEKMERTLASTRKELEQFGKATNVSGMQKLQTWCKTTGESFKTLGTKITDIGKNITTTSAMFIPATLAIAGAFKTAYSSFTNWETSLKNVQAISGFTTEQMQQVADVTKKLGAEMPLTASQVSDAFGYMSLAGYSFEEQMASIENITKASIAWGSDLGRTSDLITDSLSALQLGVEDMGHYLDVVTKAQNRSNTTAVAMTEAYIECGGTLANLGIGIEDSATALGVLA